MSDLHDRLLDDISKTGFPSELKSARVLLNRKWDIGQNEHYIDYDLKKGREIDLFCLKADGTRADDATYMVFDHLYVEVKKSTDKPWVVFTSEKVQNDFSRWSLIHSATFQKRYTLTQEDLLHCHYAMDHPRLGRTAYQAFRKDNLDPHMWVLGALKASLYLQYSGALEHARQSPTEERSEPSDFLCLTLHTPLVVFDGPLFEAFLSPEGKVEICERAYIPYSCDYGSTAYRGRRYLVEIVALGGLDEYLAKREAWHSQMVAYLEKHKNIRPMKNPQT